MELTKGGIMLDTFYVINIVLIAFMSVILVYRLYDLIYDFTRRKKKSVSDKVSLQDRVEVVRVVKATEDAEDKIDKVMVDLRKLAQTIQHQRNLELEGTLKKAIEDISEIKKSIGEIDEIKKLLYGDPTNIRTLTEINKDIESLKNDNKRLYWVIASIYLIILAKLIVAFF